MSEIEEYEAKIHATGVCEVVRAAPLTPRMRRITFQGAPWKGLERFSRPEMLIRLYFPPPGGNTPPEPFLNAEGTLDFRTPPGTEVSPFSAFSEDPLVRAYTARHYRPESLELDIDFVLHDETPGLASDWARAAKPGDRLGVVEFALPAGHRPATVRDADIYLLFADEAGLPAAQTNLEGFAPGKKVFAFLEVADRLEEQKIETRADVSVTWTDGTIDGQTLTWTMAMKLPRPLIAQFRALVKGDTLSGHVSLGTLGQAPFKGGRS